MRLQRYVITLAVTAATLHAESILSVPSTTAHPNDVFSLPIQISGVTNLTAVQFDVTYDPTILKLDEIREGPFLPSVSTAIFVPGSIDNSQGLSTYTVEALIGAYSTASGDGVLAYLDMRALTPGQSEVTVFNVVGLGASRSKIPIKTNAGNVTVTPEPKTVLATFMGCFALWFFTKKKAAMFN